jgi:hypothetical protein
MTSACRNDFQPMQCRGAKSFVDDLGLSRGVVLSRAAFSLRSIETKPSDSKICPHWTDTSSSQTWFVGFGLVGLCLFVCFGCCARLLASRRLWRYLFELRSSGGIRFAGVPHAALPLLSSTASARVVFFRRISTSCGCCRALWRLTSKDFESSWTCARSTLSPTRWLAPAFEEGFGLDVRAFDSRSNLSAGWRLRLLRRTLGSS